VNPQGVIPSVPVWTVLRSREEFAASDMPLLTVTSAAGVGIRDTSEGRAPSADLSGYRVVRRGDLVVNRLWARFGAYGVSPFDGIISPAYWVLKVDGGVFHPPYLHHLVRSGPYLADIGRRSKNMPPNGFDLPWDQFRLMRLPALPLQDQRRIAAFLDAETARIDRLVGLRSGSAALVKARAQSALSELFSNPIWGQTKLKHLLARGACYGVLVPRFVDGGGVPFIRVSDLNDLESRAGDLVQIDAALSAEYSRTIVRNGDLLIAVVGSCGLAALVPESAEGANLARAVARIQVREGVDAHLLWCWTQTLDFSRQVALSTGSDTAQPTLNVGDLSNFTLSLPESGAESRRASQACREIIDWRDRALAMTASHLDLLRERKQALVTAAITGQLDVTTTRGVA
jgi:type I restriction enzyme S subunit